MRNIRRKVIFDVGHPAEVHHYYWTARELRRRGWRCLFVAKDKDVILDLLRAYDLRYVVMARNRGGIFTKLLQAPLDLWRFYCILRRFRPQRIVSDVSLHAAWVSAFCGVPHIAFIDTEPRRLMDLLTLGFVDYKVTSTSYRRRLGRNHLRYNGNHELAYLHPERFQPDPEVRRELGLAKDEAFIIVRFIAWRALHDWGLPRMSGTERLQLVQFLKQKAVVFISAEDSLPPELEGYRFPLPAQRLLHALAFAELYVGEGITTASEAAVLGTPAVLINAMRVGYCEEEERYGMLFYFERPNPAFWQKLEELTACMPVRPRFAERHREFLRDKIDVSETMRQIIEEGSRKQ